MAQRAFLAVSLQKPPRYWWCSCRTCLNAHSGLHCHVEKQTEAAMDVGSALRCHSWVQDSEDFFSTLPFRVSRMKTKSNSSFVFNCNPDTMSPIVFMFYRFLKHFTSQMMFLIKSLWANIVNIFFVPLAICKKMSLVPHTGEQEKPVLSSNKNIHQQHLKEKFETFSFH